MCHGTHPADPGFFHGVKLSSAVAKVSHTFKVTSKMRSTGLYPHCHRVALKMHLLG
jgi:hypothetical protein